MVEEIKKRNHFLPKTYLEKFLNNDNILYFYKKGKKFFKEGITKKDRLITVIGKDGLNNRIVTRFYHEQRYVGVRERSSKKRPFTDSGNR